MVENILDCLFSICSSELLRNKFNSVNDPLLPQDDFASQCIEMMNQMSFLATINLNDFNLDINQLTAMFLNLYHIMTLYAYLVAGIPASFMAWPGFFNCYSFEAFGDIFTIAELEHCVIKNGKKRRSFNAKLNISQSVN